MITAGFGLESFVSGRPRTAVRRDPMAESRIRANEMTSSIAGNLVIVVPFAIEHESHIGSPFPAIAILVSKAIGIRKLQAICCNETASAITICIDTFILL